MPCAVRHCVKGISINVFRNQRGDEHDVISPCSHDWRTQRAMRVCRSCVLHAAEGSDRVACVCVSAKKNLNHFSACERNLLVCKFSALLGAQQAVEIELLNCHECSDAVVVCTCVCVSIISRDDRRDAHAPATTQALHFTTLPSGKSINLLCMTIRPHYTVYCMLLLCVLRPPMRYIRLSLYGLGPVKRKRGGNCSRSRIVSQCVPTTTTTTTSHLPRFGCAKRDELH